MKKILLIGLIWILPYSVFAEVSPQMISFNCQTCHIKNGEFLTDLKQLSSEQIKNSLLDFKYDKQQSTVMGRIAKGFTDAELIQLARSISQNK